MTDIPSEQTDLSAANTDEKARARARIGQLINSKWTVDALLGVGGMAAVYAATHRNGSRKALKILNPEFARDAGVVDRFLREAYVANKIDHRGRVSIEDDGVTEEGELFLVMELLEGETAQQLWKRKNRKVPPDEALWIAIELLDTLGAFHAQGVIHRDLKPANVFITRDNVVKLLDFGVARMRDTGGDHTRAGTALGTPSFMAPEQAMGLTDGVDARADLFSVGATLFALMSGQRLHQGRTDNEAFILAATTPAPSLARVAPEIPVEVVSLVDKALAWDRRARYENAAVMRDEVQRVLDAVGGPPPDRRTAEQMRRAEGERARKADAAAAPIVEPLKPDDPDEEAAPDDPGVIALIDVGRRLERLLPTVRHYGWKHPETDNKLRAAYQGIIEVLRANPNGVAWKLTPYAFTYRKQVVWEPNAPLDVVPYHLFAAGLRRLQLLTGFTEDELRSLCEVMLIDPATDLAPEDDVAAALWEKRLEHVRYDVINVFAEGDAADREAFWAETDDVETAARRAAEEKANRVEAAAMAVETDLAALRASRHAHAALALDPVTRKALASQLAMTPERWSERFIDVIADAILNARRHGDLELVVEPLDASTRDMILQRRFDLVFSVYDAICKAVEAYAPRGEAPAIKAALTAGIFAPESLRMLLREAFRAPGSLPAGVEPRPIDLDQLTNDLTPVISTLGPQHLAVILDIVGSAPHEGLRKVLLGYLERTLPGREAEVVDRLMTIEIDVARPILKILASVKKASAAEALRRLAGCANASLRCEAVAQLATSPEQLKDELAQLAESPQPELRMAALRTLAHHQVRAAGPLLVRRVQDPSFHQLSTDERRELLTALYRLNPSRAEALLIEALDKHGLIKTEEPQEQTRAIAAELLGREARSMEALNAALNASKRRWWNSQPVRDKALPAAEAIAGRLGKRITEAGEIA